MRPNPKAGGWEAALMVGRKRIHIGRYLDEEDAARAYDRAAIALQRRPMFLNFPDERPRPATIQTLRKEAAAGLPVLHSSALRGVTWVPLMGHSPWRATITVGPRTFTLGLWPTEREAALAHDRAALHVGGPQRKLNFPGAARKLGARTPKELRADAHRIYKETTSSRFRGVSWASRNELWVAAIVHRGVKHYLGGFHDEERAAEAYDEAAKRLHRKRATLNFPGG